MYLNWRHEIFRAFYYIGIAAPILYILIVAAVCISQYMKLKAKRNQTANHYKEGYKISKKHRRKKHYAKDDNQSESSLCKSNPSHISFRSSVLKREHPKHMIHTMHETCIEMNDFQNKCIDENYTPSSEERRHSNDPDIILLLEEASKLEHTSGYRTESSEKLLNTGSNRSSYQELLTSSTLSKRKKAFKQREAQRKLTQLPQWYNYELNMNEYEESDTGRKDENSVTLCSIMVNANSVLSTEISRDSTHKPDKILVDAIPRADPNDTAGEVHDYKARVHDIGYESPREQNMPVNLENSELSKQFKIFHQNELSGDQFIKDKYSVHTATKNRKCLSKISEAECFPHDKFNPQLTNEQCKVSETSVVYQDRNNSVVKRILEDCYDIRQKISGVENTLRNTSNSYRISKLHKSMQDETFMDKPKKRNQTENTSNSEDSTGKEEILCRFWKSLKIDPNCRKKDKAIQAEVPLLKGYNTGFLSQECAIDTNNQSANKVRAKTPNFPSTQNKSTDTGDITAKISTPSSIYKQGQRIIVNKARISEMPPQTKIKDDEPKVRSFSSQTIDDIRNSENRTYKDCRVLRPRTEYMHDRDEAGICEPRQLHPRPRFNNLYASRERLQSYRTQVNEVANPENYRYLDDCCLNPNCIVKHKDAQQRYNRDDEIQCKYDCIRKPLIPASRCGNNQHFYHYDEAIPRQINEMNFENRHVPIKNPLINLSQTRRYDNHRYTIPTFDQIHRHKNRHHHLHEQMEKRKHHLSETQNSPHGFHKYPTIKSANDFDIYPNFWKNDNINNEIKEFHRGREIQIKDKSVRPILHDNRPDDFDFLERGMIASPEKIVLVRRNNKREYNKQSPREAVNEPISFSENDMDSVSEKAEAAYKREEVVRRIRGMYPHIDRNIHETNKHVVSQVKEVLKMKGKWKAEAK